jgi:hypothetical protein
MVCAGVRGALTEEALVHSLERSLAARPLRSIGSASEALALFQRSLGLLVEQGPGMYGFLHLTLAEYFAAWELVRSGELEALVRDPKQAFLPEWREVILLAAGELGVNRADDARLDHLVEALIASASRRRGRPSLAVPSLLTGLLADDPGLSEHAARAIAECLIPTWWFERRYSGLLEFGSLARTIANRIARGRFAGILREQLRGYFDQGPSSAALDKLDSRIWSSGVRSIARSLDVDDSTIFFLALRKNRRQVVKERWRWIIPISIPGAALAIGRGLVEACRNGAVRLTIRGTSEHPFMADFPALFSRIPSVPLHVHWRAADLSSGDAAYLNVPFTIEPSAGEGEGASITVEQIASAYIADWELREEPPISPQDRER